MKTLEFLAAAYLLAGCTTVEPGYEPPTPVIVEDTPDETFVKEFDSCWATYRACLDTHEGSRQEKDKICFPPMEDCGVAAYRKLKKARER